MTVKIICHESNLHFRQDKRVTNYHIHATICTSRGAGSTILLVQYYITASHSSAFRNTQMGSVHGSRFMAVAQMRFGRFHAKLEGFEGRTDRNGCCATIQQGNNNAMKKYSLKQKKSWEDDCFSIPMTMNKNRKMKMELYICQTNEIKPYRSIRELGVVVFDESNEPSDYPIQIDNGNDFGIEEIERLIKFLNKAKRNIKKFNENSLPINNTNQ